MTESIRMVMGYKELFLKGLGYTMMVSVEAIIVAVCIGTILTVLRMGGDSLFNRIIQKIVAVYISFVRGTPILVQIYIIFQALSMLGLNLSAYTSGVIALSLNSGGFMAEILRGGFSAIPKGQIEAAEAIGMPKAKIWTRIILPQVFRIVIPQLTRRICETSAAQNQKGIKEGKAMGEFLHVAEIAFPLLFQGILVTIQISVLAIIMAIVIGAVVAYMKISDMVLLKAIAEIYIKIFRNTPFMVQVYLAYYGLPMLGLNVPAFWTGALILGFYTAAYVAVILESGLSSLPKGQSEAAYAIGMSKTKTLLRILLPQTVMVIIPSITGQLVQTVKDSSVLSIITVAEMTMMTKEAIGITFSPLIVYICVGLLYWALNLVIELSSKKIEKSYKRRSI